MNLKIVINVKKYFIFLQLLRIFSIWVFQWIIMASVQDPNSLRSLRVDPMWTRPHRKFQKNRIFSNRTKIRGLEPRSKITSQGSTSKSTRGHVRLKLVILDRHFSEVDLFRFMLVRMSEIDSDFWNSTSYFEAIFR